MKKSNDGHAAQSDARAKTPGTTSPEEVAPHHVSAQRDVILAALRRGPVLRQLPMSQKPFGLLMAVDHLRHGGSWASLASAGLARWIYLAVVLVAVIGAVGVTAIGWATATPVPVYHGVGLCLSRPLLTTEGTYYLEILEVLPNTPAAAAGLGAHDRILAVNGETITVPQRAQFRGDSGSTITLTVKRAGETTTEHVILTRSEIPESLYERARERNPYSDTLVNTSQI